MKLKPHILLLILGLFYFTDCFSQYIDTACVGEKNVRYKVALNSGSNYNWLVTGGTIVNGQGTNDIGVDWGTTAGVFQISVTESNATNCLGDETIAKVLIENKPIVSISGPDSICKDQKFTYKLLVPPIILGVLAVVAMPFLKLLPIPIIILL